MAYAAATRLRRYLLVASFLFLSFFFLTAKKFFEYAAPPTAPKDCDFIYPAQPGHTTATTLVLSASAPRPLLFQQGGFINDASCLNKTAIYGIVKISSVEDLRTALRFARENGLKVTVAGQRHSMGGHSFIKGGLVLDMRSFNQLSLDKERVLTVQSGATWAQVQRFLDHQGLSVKAMQSINIFTIGGSLSVNGHGIAHESGQIAPTVRSIHVMLASGEIKNASLTENPDLFRHVLGGYGLFGIILDADLDVIANEAYRWNTKYLSYKDFADYYETKIAGNPRFGLAYGRLSISPTSYLTEAALHTFERIPSDGPIEPLTDSRFDWLDRLVINFSKTGGLGRWTRWQLEKYVGPRIHPCLSRNQRMAQEEGCLVSRNEEMYDSMNYLKNRLRDADILQEYFIPPQNMSAFVDGLREIVKQDDSNLLNVTIRFVHQDTITALPYAKQDMFSYVLYFNQKLDISASRKLQKTTTDLIDLVLRLHGTYYLPYQLYYSEQQLHVAYPGIGAFFAAKKQYDPLTLFTNSFYEKYGRQADD
jgi:FAD/FMN-containing dehydrogenase